MRKTTQEHSHARGHFEIEGQMFENSAGIYAIARRRGFNGSRSLIDKRLRQGCNTWDALLAPVAAGRVKVAVAGGKASAAKRQRERDEIARLLAEIDARKAAMGIEK